MNHAQVKSNPYLIDYKHLINKNILATGEQDYQIFILSSSDLKFLSPGCTLKAL